MSNLRARVVVAILLAGATFASPLYRLAVLGRAPRADSVLKRVDVRTAKRLRSTLTFAPRLTRGEAGLDGGRPRPVVAGRPLPPAAADRGPPAGPTAATALVGPRSSFPLRC